MRSLNQVQLIGNLGDDPEVKYLQSGTQLATMSIATTDKWKDKKTEEDREETQWHRVTFFGPLAEVCAEYLHKGDKIYISGSLKYSKTTDDDGNDKFYTNITGREMLMLGSPNKGGIREGGGPSPAQSRAATSKSEEKRLAATKGKAKGLDQGGESPGEPEFDDDIPF